MTNYERKRLEVMSYEYRRKAKRIKDNEQLISEKGEKEKTEEEEIHANW